MLKRTLQVRVVKDTKHPAANVVPTTEPSIDYTQIVRESVKVIVVGIVVVSAVTTVLNTIAEITVSNVTKS